jgi:hypothetical protein
MDRAAGRAALLGKERDRRSGLRSFFEKDGILALSRI